MGLILAIKSLFSSHDEIDEADDDLFSSSDRPSSDFDDMDDDEWYINPAYHSPNYGRSPTKS